MSPDDAYTQLRVHLHHLFLLNPDLGMGELEAIYLLAERVDGTHFDELAQTADSLINRYLASPPKLVERVMMTEYFDYLERSARLLDDGERTSGGSPSRSPDGPSVALVHRGHYSSLQWCRVVHNAGIPRTVARAVDACRRRNDLLGSVVEFMLVVLQLVDREKALTWQLQYLETNGEELDPDIARDFLSAWYLLDTITPAQTRWAMRWSADEELQQQWPTVVRRADRLLCRHALRTWSDGDAPRNPSLAHLRLMVSGDVDDEQRYLRWLKRALETVAEGVEFFIQVTDDQSRSDDSTATWRSGALVREIRRAEALFTPILLTADLILDVPDGAYLFAMAVFGLVGRGREAWEKRLLQHAEDVVRRTFLTALRDGTPPATIIEKLTFGDRAVALRLFGELDWATRQFDSVKQREKVIQALAVFYASYREAALLATEVSKRYRNLMRLLHEDNLRRVLEPQYADEIIGSPIVRELSTLCADARRFLTHRRALDSSIEEMVAAEIDFSREIRRRRLRFIRALLSQQ